MWTNFLESFHDAELLEVLMGKVVPSPAASGLGSCVEGANKDCNGLSACVSGVSADQSAE